MISGDLPSAGADCVRSEAGAASCFLHGAPAGPGWVPGLADGARSCLGCGVLEEALADSPAAPLLLELARQAESSPTGEAGVELVVAALERMAAGDPRVRLATESLPPPLRPLGEAVNAAARNLEEIVEDSHEFAMGLAEHFDVLRRVTDGDLTARIRGAPRMEILQLLKEMTNATVGTLADEILARRDAESRLEVLALGMEQAAEGVAVTATDGSIRYLNPAFGRLCGHAIGDTLGAALGLSTPGPQGDRLRRAMWRSLHAGEVWSGYFINVRRDGSRYDEECTISPVIAPDGTVTHYVIVKRDVSEEMELKRRLGQSQRLEALGTLAGGIAHEFNNLLAAMVGYTELSLDAAAPGSELEDNLERVLAVGDRAADLISQILAFSRVQEDAPDPVAVVPAVRSTLKLLRATLPTSVEIRAQIDETPARVLSSETQVQQILMNLGTNAGHAMREQRGVLEVVVAERVADGEEQAPGLSLKPGRYVSIQVSDSGCGIPAEILERIFEPFFTTKAVGEGTGLGLAVVHGIVHGCGGDIAVDSVAGVGTTVTVYLPVADCDAVDAVADRPAVPRGSERVLVVDDEAIIADVLRQQLERLGYQVTACTRSPEAVSLFEQDPTAFDLVVTDQTMPELTGGELVRILLDIRPNLPVILCTGFSESMDGQRAADLGVRQFLLKPIRVGELGHAVRRALDEVL